MLTLCDQRVSVVIPSARAFPEDLVRSLEKQLCYGDEIVVVQNRPLLGSRHWIGVPQHAPSPLDPKAAPQEPFATAGMGPTHFPITPHLTVVVSDEGAAAARNRGWRVAQNDSILFLDDDVTIEEKFVSLVREYLANSPMAGAATFRIIDGEPTPWSLLIRETISMDRGATVRRTHGASVRLRDVWMYGAGAAMMVSRGLLEETGGFKEDLGAGRRNGGTEDMEFLWHASRHAEVEYVGHIAVAHASAAGLPIVARKLREYGRAIGNLGGTTRDIDGFQYAINYCWHILHATFTRNIGLPALSRFRIRVEAIRAVVETLVVYVSSAARVQLIRSLCDECRRGTP